MRTMLKPAVGVLTVVPIVAVLGMRAFGLASAPDEFWIVASIALGGAALVGLPALRWAMEHGRTRVVHLGVIGALAGVVVPLIVLVSGIVGQAAHGGLDYARWVLAHGASLPWYGAMRWSIFSALIGECAIIGAVSGAIVTVFVSDPRPASL
jgi:hypothetical protein